MAFREPTARERRIMIRNEIDPNEVSVMIAGDDYIVAINHRSRDTIRIERGERPWPIEAEKV